MGAVLTTPRAAQRVNVQITRDRQTVEVKIAGPNGGGMSVGFTRRGALSLSVLLREAAESRSNDVDLETILTDPR